MKRKKKKTFKLKYFLILGIMIAILNISKNILGLDFNNIQDVVINKTNLEDSNQKVKINEELVFQSENLEKNDINNAGLEDFLKIGLTNKKAKLLQNRIEFLGYVDNFNFLTNIKGLNSDDVELIKTNFNVSQNEDKYIKRNINDISEKDMSKLGFSKKEIEYILNLRQKGMIKSDIDLKNKVNNEILEKYIIF